jgi:hypothetical protein
MRDERYTCNNGPDDSGKIGPKLVKVSESSSHSLAATKRTKPGFTISGAGTPIYSASLLRWPQILQATSVAKLGQWPTAHTNSTNITPPTVSHTTPSIYNTIGR